MADENVVVEQTTEIAVEQPTSMTNMDNLTPNYDVSAFSNMKNFKELYDIGKMFATSNLIPEAYQKKPMDCAIAVDIANRMGVSPMFVMQNLWVVRGIPSWSGQACMGIIRASGKYKDVKPVYVGTPNSDNWGCYISAIDLKGDEVKGTTVTMQMAKDEGWLSKSGSKWKTMPQQMLAYRASTFFARVYCSNELLGFKVEGEVEDIQTSKQPQIQGKGTNPFQDIADDLPFSED